MPVTKTAATVALLAASALALTSCASSKRDDNKSTGNGKSDTNATLNFEVELISVGK